MKMTRSEKCDCDGSYQTEGREEDLTVTATVVPSILQAHPITVSSWDSKAVKAQDPACSLSTIVVDGPSKSIYDVSLAPCLTRTFAEQSAALKSAIQRSRVVGCKSVWDDQEANPRMVLTRRIAEWAFQGSDFPLSPDESKTTSLRHGQPKDPKSIRSGPRDWVSRKTMLDRLDWIPYLTWWAIVALAVAPIFMVVEVRQYTRPEILSSHNFDSNDLFSMLVFCVLMVRNELFVWMIYRIGIVLAAYAPYHIKRAINKMIYNIGAIHTGLSIFLVLLSILGFANETRVVFPILSTPRSQQIQTSISFILLWVLDGLFMIGLLMICISAVPALRHQHHNWFEFSHRYIGWALATVVAARIAVVICFNDNTASDISLYFGAASIALIFWPWLLITKRKVSIQSPSDMVALLTWDNKPWFSCAGTAARVSFSFAKDYHPFALLCDVTPDKAMLAVATAGDWTRECNNKGAADSLKDQQQAGNDELSDAAKTSKEHIMWIRRFATPGFMYLLRTYKRVVCIATGAGIAPIASYLPNPGVEMMILWVGRNFKETYGDLLPFVLAHKDSVLVDTRAPPSKCNPYEPSHNLMFTKSGTKCGKEKAGKKRYGDRRPNLPLLAMAAVELFAAEAVFIVSGPKPTYEVVYEMWRHGIHAYGATWDS